MQSAEDAGPLVPKMSAVDLAILTKYLALSPKVVEFGSGGSTELAIRSGVTKIWSVENAAEWVTKLRDRSIIREAEANGRLVFKTVDLGPIEAYGRPTGDPVPEVWPLYYQWLASDKEAQAANMFFVDGRFRVACILEAIMVGRPDAIIMVHDYWSRRRYHVVLPFLDLVERGDEMAVFRAKRLSWPESTKMKAVLKKHMLVS